MLSAQLRLLMLQLSSKNVDFIYAAAFIDTNKQTCEYPSLFGWKNSHTNWIAANRTVAAIFNRPVFG